MLDLLSEAAAGAPLLLTGGRALARSPDVRRARVRRPPAGVRSDRAAGRQPQRLPRRAHELQLTAEVTPGISVYFNRGIVAAQWVARRLRETAHNLQNAKLTTVIATPDDPFRTYLSGPLGQRLLDLLDTAVRDGRDVYAALYELDDPQLEDVLLNNPALAGEYHRQWERLRDAGNTTPDTLHDSNTSPRRKTVGQASVTLWFTPVVGQIDLDDARTLIANARHAILFRMFNPGPRDTLLNKIIETARAGTSDQRLYIHGCSTKTPAPTRTRSCSS